MGKPIRIFLSHDAQDRAVCELLKANAAAMGVEVYLAEHDLRPGMNLAAKVTEAIDESDAIVVLLSTDRGSRFVDHEVGYAIKAKKVIVPLVQPGLTHDQLGMLQGLEHIPFDIRNPHEGSSRLNAALKRLLDRRDKQRDTAVLVTLACLALVLIAADSGSATPA